MNLLLLVAAFFLSMLITEAVRRLAQKMALIDIPVDRSLHSVPTPRGGGLGIALSVILVGTLWFTIVPTSNDAVPVILFSTMAALLGFWDDRRPLSAKFRLTVQFGLAVLLLIAFYVQFPPDAFNSIFGVELPLAITLPILTLAMVWITNLYNFMDGSDGLAASQAVTVFVSLALLCFLNDEPEVAVTSTLVAAASLGFLTRNWPPAKIFMGDVGSIFLGYISSATIIWVSLRGEINFYAAICLHGAFIVDATVTLITRYRLGKVTHQAHRTHAYQRWIQSGKSHKFIALSYSLVNLFWLLPFAFFIERMGSPLAQVSILILAWLPLAFFAVRMKAGHEYIR